MSALKDVEPQGPVKPHDDSSHPTEVIQRKGGGDEEGDLGSEKEKAEEDEIAIPDDWYPEGGWRAWKVVLGCFIFASCQLSYGMVWGVVVVAMKDTPLFQNVPYSTLNLIIGLNNVTPVSLSFITGRLGDKFGHKKMLLIGTVMVYVCFILSATVVRSLVAAFFFQGFFIGFSLSIGMPSYMSIPSFWFKRRRGLATGVVVAGTGFGGAISNLIVRGLVPRVGYHHALLIWGSINFAMTLPAWFLVEVRTPPVRQINKQASTRWLPEGMLRSPVFYFFLFSLFLGNFGILSPLYFLTSYTKLQCPQLDPNGILPALPLVLATACAGFGRIGAGLLADHIGPVNAFVLTWLIGGVLQVVFWPLAKSFGAILAFGALYGLTGTSYLSLMPVCCAKLFGIRGLATITGASAMSTAPGQFAGTTIAGLILTRAGGNYSAVAYYAGSMMIAAAVSAMLANVASTRRLFAKQ